MYLPDQPGMVAQWKRLLAPGGTLIVQEHDASLQHSTTPLPLHAQASRWIWDTVRAEGANTATGFALYGLLTGAGFTKIDITAEAIVTTPDTPGMRAAIIRAILPRIEAAGVATAGEIDTLEARLKDELTTTGATLIDEHIFGAIARAH